MSANKRNIIFTFMVIILATAFFMLRGTGGVTVDSTDGGLTFTGSAGSTMLAYADITDIQYFPAPDYGTGEISRGFCHGVWESPELGIYTAYLDQDISGCILFISDKETVAFNYESEATTRGFYESIRELWIGKTGG